MKNSPSWSGSIVALLSGIALAVVLWLPASVPTAMIAKRAEGRLDFSHVRGTAWAGSTELALVKPNKAEASIPIPGRIHWHWLWQGWIPELVVNSDCCFSQPVTFKLILGTDLQQLSISDVKINFPLTILEGLGAPFNTLKPNGDLQIETRKLKMTLADRVMKVSGDADFELGNLSSVLSQVKPIGTYTVAAKGQGDRISFKLSTRSGALQLSGSGELTQKKFRFNAEATSSPGYELAMSNLLNVIGRRSGNRSIISMEQ
jgi:general secretion pathway protein N